MNYNDVLISILDDTGKVVATKPRGSVDKLHDVLRVVHVLVFHSGQLYLGRIPTREGYATPFSGKLGATVATVVREDETNNEAARRAILKETLLRRYNEPKFLQEHFSVVAGRKRFVSVYALEACEDLTTDKMNKDEIAEIIPVSKVELEMKLQKPEEFTDTFLGICKENLKDFPF